MRADGKAAPTLAEAVREAVGAGVEAAVGPLRVAMADVAVKVEARAPSSVYVSVPSQPPPVVNVTVSPQPAPVVNVTIPERVVEMAAPTITVAPPAVEVAAPQVTIAPADVHVHLPPAGPRRRRVERDDDGLVTRIVDEAD